MRPHLRYLRYVLIHKLYVFMAGMAIARHLNRTQSWPRTLWRYLVHDLSKFGRAEWGPYVRMFYGENAEAWIERRAKALAHHHLDADTQQEIGGQWVPAVPLGPPRGVATPANLVLARRRAEGEWSEVKKQRQAAFDRAWLHHLHHNPHHWQHWILREDSGGTKVLLPEGWYVDEMVADWIGAGTKVLRWPSLAEAVAETVVFYVANREKMVLRDPVRQRVEHLLNDLASIYGLKDFAFQQHTSTTIRVPTRPVS